MTRIFFSVLITAIIIQVSSCHIFKKTSKTPDLVQDTIKKEEPKVVKYKTTPTMLLVDSLAAMKEVPENINYHFKGKLKSKNSNMPVNGVVGIKKDSVVWVSVRPGLGIEIGRLYFFNDSLFILDRLNSEYYAYAYKQLQKKTKVYLDYNIFQSFFAASFFTIDNPGKPKAYNYKHVKEKDYISLFCRLTGRKEHRENISYSGNMLSNMIKDSSDKNLFKTDFKYSQNGNKNFPVSINAELNTENKINFNFKVFKYSEKKRTIPALKIPKYYKKAELKL